MSRPIVAASSTEKKSKFLNVKAIVTARGLTSEADVTLRYWSKKAAKRRGINICLFIFSIGTAATINPLLLFHFVIPPIWLYIGPWVGKRVYRAYADLIEFRKGTTRCPVCEQETDFYPYGPFHAFRAICKQCQEPLAGHLTEEIVLS